MPRPFQSIVFPLTGSYFHDELTKQIDLSRTKIRSIQYQWKWNTHERHSRVQRLGACVARARSRNVMVEVILHEESPSKHLTRINSISGDALARLGCQIRHRRTAGLLHTKLWIIDNKLTFVGSHNISGRSLGLNEEVTVMIDSEPFASFMNTYFDNLWA